MGISQLSNRQAAKNGKDFKRIGNSRKIKKNPAIRKNPKNPKKSKQSKKIHLGFQISQIPNPLFPP
jgi:hypothetical protein